MSIIIPDIIIIFLLFIVYFLVFKSCFLALQTVTNCGFYQLFFFSDFFASHIGLSAKSVLPAIGQQFPIFLIRHNPHEMKKTATSLFLSTGQIRHIPHPSLTGIL